MLVKPTMLSKPTMRLVHGALSTVRTASTRSAVCVAWSRRCGEEGARAFSSARAARKPKVRAAPKGVKENGAISQQLGTLYSQLGGEVEAFEQWNDETCKAEVRAKGIVLNIMRRIVLDMVDGIEIYAFGSYSYNLCVPGGDLDLKICLPEEKEQSSKQKRYQLRRFLRSVEWQDDVSAILQKQEWVMREDFELVKNARVPIIRFKAKIDGIEVPVDLGVQQKPDHSEESQLMVQKYLREYPALRPLVIFLKNFLRERGLNITYDGGLSSWPLFLLVVHYFQMQERWQSGDQSSNLGKLLMGFFRYYGVFFNPKATSICVKEGRALNRNTIEKDAFEKYPVVIYSPFDKTVNTGGGFYKCYTVFRIFRKVTNEFNNLQYCDTLPPNMVKMFIPDNFRR
jgi:non-canonical poly(A) RNA polymerase PAPD5/7